MGVVVFLPFTEVFVTKEARNIVLCVQIGVPVKASISECVKGSLVRFRVRPLDAKGEGFGSGSLCDFSCQPERLLPLHWAKHRICHRSVVAVVVVVVAVGWVGGWLDSDASAVDH